MGQPGPSERAVARLLRAAECAGLVAGSVARWGGGGSDLGVVASGHARMLPQPRFMSEHTWLDLASLTKPLVTTTLVLLALRSGAVSLTTRVDSVLHETAGSAVGRLPLWSLLNHSSGLPAWLPLYCLVDRPCADEVLRCLARLEPTRAPGEEVVYSCLGFIVLGMMLERLSGCDLVELASARILRPLRLDAELGFRPDPGGRDLAAGALEPSSEVALVRARGLDATRVPATAAGLPDDGNARFLGGAAGNAGLFGTAAGVWRLAREYRRGGGDLLTAAEAALATSPASSGLEQCRTLGWQRAATSGSSAGPSLPRAAVGHTGFTGVSVWLTPHSGACSVLLANRVHPLYRGADLHPLRRRFHALTAAPSTAV